MPVVLKVMKKGNKLDVLVLLSSTFFTSLALFSLTFCPSDANLRKHKFLFLLHLCSHFHKTFLNANSQKKNLHLALLVIDNSRNFRFKFEGRMNRNFSPASLVLCKTETLLSLQPQKNYEFPGLLLLLKKLITGIQKSVIMFPILVYRIRGKKSTLKQFVAVTYKLYRWVFKSCYSA